MPIENALAHLKQTNLFSEFCENDLIIIADKLKQKVYPANTIVVKEGASSDSMFIIREGEVQVRRKQDGSGADRFITTLQAGHCFGEIGLLTGRPRSATVATLVTTEVFVLEKEDLHTILNENASIAITIGAIVASMEDMNPPRSMGGGSISLSNISVGVDVLTSIPKTALIEHRMIPISLSSDQITMAMVNPADLLAQDHISRFIKGVKIQTARISDDEFHSFMTHRYAQIIAGSGDGPKATESIAAQEPIDLSIDLGLLEERNEPAVSVGEVEKEAGQAPIIKLANNIIELALKKGASDIHVEPAEKGVRLRYRIDGVLLEEKMLPRKVLLPLVSRMKIMAHLDITERRIPQDGRISLKIGGKIIDFRLSTMPSKYGEKVVVRILDKDAQILSLKKLVSHESSRELIQIMTKKPYGIVYVTGPTGSGKTTTLYSALSEINKPEVNILTAEDPIEYDLPGITQVQVNSDIGLDFARVIRAFLRQDPDIILVGETRDHETAKIAVQAALTGHLVFTTVHTNDASSTFARLIEMGMDPFLVSTSLIGVIAQRLVRRICPKCREPYSADHTAIKYLNLKEGTIIFRGSGCSECNHTGYRGRSGVFEVLIANEEIRHLVAHGASTEQVRNKCIEHGMVTLKDYALTLLHQGITTVDEVLRTVVVES
jgi:type IV pilus assembly protein PilB